MAIIDFFKDRWGRIIYPKTVAQAIYDLESGERLDKYFDKNFYEKIGDPAFLETVDKSTLVSAINELKGKHDSHLADDTAHNLNLKANKKLGELTNITLQNGWGGEISCRKNDVGIVSVYAYLTPTGIPTGVIATLPAGYRPLQSHVNALVNKGNINPYDVGIAARINTDGTIVIRKPLVDLLTQGNNDGLSFSAIFQA